MRISQLARAARQGYSKIMSEGSLTHVDHAVERLANGATEFARAPIGRKVAWLEQMGDRLVDVQDAWVRAACEARSIDPAGVLAGEEWLLGPTLVARTLRLLGESLRSLDASGAVQVPAVHTREGALAVEVVPASRLDAVLYKGVRCEVRLEPGIGPADIAANQAVFYARRDPEGAVALVLGAGNVSSIAPMDALHELFVRGRSTLLKVNPVAEFVVPFLEHVFAPLVERNAFALVRGGGEVGAYLCNHPAIAHVHITGSNATHDRIVWGPPGPERDARRARGEPLLAKPITSELGNISPVLVVPARYSDEDVEYAARYVAGMLVHNASYNCNGAKMLVLPRNWERTAPLLEALGRALAEVPTRVAFYPGARELHGELTRGRERVLQFGESDALRLPWTVVPGLDEHDAAEPLFRREPFCPILGVVEVGSAEPDEFIAAATRFANERLWGTLNAMLFVHPSTERDPALRRRVDAAVDELRYGAVAVNQWPAMIFGLGTPPWGAYPGASLGNVESGIGWAHNTTMLERIEKAVLRAPFGGFPKPLWMPGHRTLHRMARLLAEVEHSPSWFKVPALVALAARA